MKSHTDFFLNCIANAVKSTQDVDELTEIRKRLGEIDKTIGAKLFEGFQAARSVSWFWRGVDKHP